MILRRLDRYDRVLFGHDEVRCRWPAGLLERLLELGLLRPGALTDAVACDECEHGCVVGYDLTETGRGVTVGHRCPHSGGLISAEPDRFRLWEADFHGLAQSLARDLDPAWTAEPLLPGRVCLLGQIFAATGSLDVLLARQLRRPDAASLCDRVPRLRASPAAAVLVPSDLPEPALWRGLVCTPLSLRELVAWDDARGDLGLARLRTALPALRPPAQRDHWITVSEGADLLLSDISGIDRKRATARVSFAANRGRFRTNGRKGKDRRIERVSFDAWRLQQRERELDRSDW